MLVFMYMHVYISYFMVDNPIWKIVAEWKAVYEHIPAHINGWVSFWYREHYITSASYAVKNLENPAVYQ